MRDVRFDLERVICPKVEMKGVEVCLVRVTPTQIVGRYRGGSGIVQEARWRRRDGEPRGWRGGMLGVLPWDARSWAEEWAEDRGRGDFVEMWLRDALRARDPGDWARRGILRAALRGEALGLVGALGIFEEEVG